MKKNYEKNKEYREFEKGFLLVLKNPKYLYPEI